MIEHARTIKMKDELLKERVLEKFEIERVYWERRQIDWGIVTELEISISMARNISYIHGYYDIRDFDVFSEINGQDIEELAMALLKRLLNTEESNRKVTSIFDREVHLPLGSGVTRNGKKAVLQLTVMHGKRNLKV